MRLLKYRYEILLTLFVVAYASFFSWFTILRHHTLNSHYYDLGIMNQVVYNTYRGRFLQMTDFNTGETVSRLSVHNDPLLAVLAPLYHIHPGPETLLVVQSVALALGAIAVYVLSKLILSKKSYALLFALLYLLYPPLQWTNVYDFHAVTLATPLLLTFIYLVLKKKYFFSCIPLTYALMSKEHVGLTVAVFVIVYLLRQANISLKKIPLGRLIHIFCKEKMLVFFGVASFLWVVASFMVIIPHFRESSHFAFSRYSHLGSNTTEVVRTFLFNPEHIARLTFGRGALEYYHTLLSPLGYVSLLSPFYLLASLPDLAINILSSHTTMRSIYYQYTALITPLIFLSAIYGFQRAIQKVHHRSVVIVLLLCAGVMSYFTSPLPYSRAFNQKVFNPNTQYQEKVSAITQTFADEEVVVMASGSLAPHFSSRKTILRFSPLYDKAEYIVLLRGDVLNDWYMSEENRNAYNMLANDSRFLLEEKTMDLEVYKKK